MNYKYIPHDVYQKFKKKFNNKKVKFIYDKDNLLLTIKIREDSIWLTAITVEYTYWEGCNRCTIAIDDDWDDFCFENNKLKYNIISKIFLYIKQISDVHVGHPLMSPDDFDEYYK